MDIYETRQKGSGKTTSNGYQLVYYSGSKHTIGVGVLLSKEAAELLMGFSAINERLFMIKLKGKSFDFNLIKVYIPTTDHTDEEIEELYKQIEELKKIKRPMT